MTSRRLLRSFLRTWTLCASGLCFGVLPVRAANIVWNTTSGSWSVATNWFPTQVPGPGDVAIITAAGTYDVNINGNVTVNAINLGSSGSPRLRVNNATLTTTTGIAVGSSSVLELNSGTLSGGGVSLNGHLNSTGTSSVNAALTTATTSTITVGMGFLTVADGFTNRGLLSYPATGYREFHVTNGTLTNAATGTISCATTGVLGVVLDNQGSITISAQGILILNKSGATHTSSGSVSVSGGGQFSLGLGAADTFSTSGSISVDALSVVLVSGGVFQHTGGTISGDGWFELVTTTSATFASNPTSAHLYLAGEGIVFPSALTNGAAQEIRFGPGADVTAPQLTNQVGYSLQIFDGAEALHVGTLFNLGTLSAPRSFVLDGNLNCGPLSNLAFGIGGTTPGTQFDQFVVTGAAQLAGAIFFNLENGFVPSPGDNFDLLTSPARIGWFDNTNGWDLGNDLYLVTDPAVTTSESHPYRIRAVHQKWTQVSAAFTPPVPRWGHSAVYSHASDRMIVFGGETAGGAMLSDVWVLSHPDGQSGTPTWTELHPSGSPPAARRGHSAVYDPVNTRMIVMGGETSSGTFFDDIWILTDADGVGGTSEWIHLPALPGPGIRSGHATGYDPVANRMVMWGGAQYCGAGWGDMWILSHANGLGGTPGWAIWSIAGTPPAGRRDAAAAFDPNGNRLIVYGGRTPCSTVLTNAYVLANASGAPDVGPRWDPLGAGASPVLPGQTGAPGAYDPLFDRFLLFGGLEADGSTFSAAVCLLADTRGSSAGWAELPLPATRPDARAFHSMIYDASAHRAIVFGGDADGVLQNDIWVLDLGGDAAPVTGVGPVSGDDRERSLAFSALPGPNPSSRDVHVSVRAARNMDAEVLIYDAMGRRVATLFEGLVTAGDHRWTWKADVASGIYFVLLQSQGNRDTRRVVIAH